MLKLTPAQEAAYKAHRESLKKQSELVGQMIEKCGADVDMAAGLKTLVDNINAQLTNLPPLEQVSTATEVNSILERFQASWNYSMQYCDSLFARLQDIGSRYTTMAGELNALNARVTAGELITKEKSAELCTAAVKSAVDPLMTEIVDRRKQFIEQNKWPLPEESLLSKPVAEFNAAIAVVKANIASGKALKFELNGKGHKALIANLWKPATEFNSAIEQIADATHDGPARKKVVLGAGGREELNEDDTAETKKFGSFMFKTE